MLTYSTQPDCRPQGLSVTPVRQAPYGLQLQIQYSNDCRVNLEVGPARKVSQWARTTYLQLDMYSTYLTVVPAGGDRGGQYMGPWRVTGDIGSPNRFAWGHKTSHNADKWFHDLFGWMDIVRKIAKKEWYVPFSKDLLGWLYMYWISDSLINA